MGIDLLDLKFHIEKEFSVSLNAKILQNMVRREQWRNLNAGDVLRWLEANLIAAGKPIPPDTWPRLQKCIAVTVAISPREVTLDSRFIDDLGFT